MKYFSDQESNIHPYRNFLHFIILQRKKLKLFLPLRYNYYYHSGLRICLPLFLNFYKTGTMLYYPPSIFHLTLYYCIFTVFSLFWKNDKCHILLNISCICLPHDYRCCEQGFLSINLHSTDYILKTQFRSINK